MTPTDVFVDYQFYHFLSGHKIDKYIYIYFLQNKFLWFLRYLNSLSFPSNNVFFSEYKRIELGQMRYKGAPNFLTDKHSVFKCFLLGIYLVQCNSEPIIQQLVLWNKLLMSYFTLELLKLICNFATCSPILENFLCLYMRLAELKITTQLIGKKCVAQLLVHCTNPSCFRNHVVLPETAYHSSVKNIKL